MSKYFTGIKCVGFSLHTNHNISIMLEDKSRGIVNSVVYIERFALDENNRLHLVTEGHW